MAMQSQQRWFLIGGALILTLGAMYMLREPADESEAQVGTSHYSKPEAIDRENKSLIKKVESLPDLTQRGGPVDSAHIDSAHKKNIDLFKAHAWYIPPPPKPVVVEVVKPIPTAPPIPFIYMGKLENTPQGTQVFLSARNKVLTVIVGKNVEGVWRLDKEDANALFFTYLPLGLPKVLSKATKSVVAKNVDAASNTDAANNIDTTTNDNQNQNL